MIEKRRIHVIYQDDYHYQQSGSCNSIEEAIEWTNEIDEEGGLVIAVIEGAESNPMKLDKHILNFRKKSRESDKIYVAFHGDPENNGEDHYRIREFELNEEDKVIEFLKKFPQDEDGDYEDGAPETVIRGKKLNLVRNKRYSIKE